MPQGQRALLFILIGAVAVSLGCGTGPTSGCAPVMLLNVVTVSPASATADHAAVPPGNSQQFLAFGPPPQPGCVTTQSNLTNVVWSVSDTVNVTISNTPDQTYGRATCVGATAGPVTVTATAPDVGFGKAPVGTATLTCR